MRETKFTKEIRSNLGNPRIGVKREDVEKACDTIDNLTAELISANDGVDHGNEVIESLMAENKRLVEMAAIYQRVKMLYENSIDTTKEPTRSAVQVLLREGEIGIQRQMERQQKEYVEELQAEIKLIRDQTDCYTESGGILCIELQDRIKELEEKK